MYLMSGKDMHALLWSKKFCYKAALEHAHNL